MVIFWIAIIVVVLIAYFSWKRHANSSKLNGLSSDLNIVSNGAEKNFIAFKDNQFYCSKVKNGKEKYDINQNAFFPAKKQLYLPTLGKRITDLNEEDIKKAVDYVKERGGKICFAIQILKFGSSQQEMLGLTSKKTFACAAKNGKMFFSNDPSFNEYRLVDIDFTPKFSSTYSTKTKGRAGSALVGGVLAGPVGAAIGGSRKKKSQTVAHTSEVKSTAILTLLTDDNKEVKVSIQEMSAVVNNLKTRFLHKIEINNSKKEISANMSSDDIAKRLTNLKKLADNNVITQEDFDKKKKELLKL